MGKLKALGWVVVLSVATYLLPPTAKANDYGAGHAAVVVGFHTIAGKVNAALFADYPDFAKDLTDMETVVLAGAFCYREQRARGTWNISRWDSITGNMDSTMDCVLPVVAAGSAIYVNAQGDPMINLFSVDW